MKEKNVVEFYVLCNKLKDVVRSGWKSWAVKRERIESVAEHIYGVQMLAIAMWSEFNYDNIDITKVVTMLAVHEIEEIIMGDLTRWQISKEEKLKKGKDAVKRVLSSLCRGEEVEKLIDEFNSKQSDEAKFAYFCDKLECDLQSKVYDEEMCIDLSHQQNNPVMRDAEVTNMLNKGYSFSKMWQTFGLNHYNYDDNFRKVSEFAMNDRILK